MEAHEDGTNLGQIAYADCKTQEAELQETRAASLVPCGPWLVKFQQSVTSCQSAVFYSNLSPPAL